MLSKIILCVSLAAATVTAQIGGGGGGGAAQRISTITGIPSAGCAVAGDVGKVRIRRDVAGTSNPIYACSNTGVGTYSWVNSGTSSGVTGLSVDVDGTVKASVGLTTAAPYLPTYSVAGTTTCNWALSNECDVVASGGNTTLAVSNPHGAGPYTLVIVQDTTLRTITAPGSFSSGGFCDWNNDVAVSTRTTITLHYDGSANYYQDTCRTNGAGLAGPEQTEVTSSISGHFVASFSNISHTFIYYANGSSNRHAIPRVASGDQMASTDLSDASNVVLKNAGNIFSTGAQDFGAATSLKIPVGAGLTAATNGFLGYDSTANMLHAAQSSADAFVPQSTATPANNDCAKWVVSGSNYKIGTAGAACGSGGVSGGTVVPKTANYTFLSTDTANSYTFDGSALTGTLPATVPAMPWIVAITNISATNSLTVARNGNTINKATGYAGTKDVTLLPGQSTTCMADTVTANNYVCPLPINQTVSVFNAGTITIPPGNSVIVGCTSTCTVPVPIPAANYQICVKNDAGVATVITLSALGGSAMYPKADDSGYGTAGTGTMVSTAAAGNKVCLIGRDSTHYELGAVNASANWTVN